MGQQLTSARQRGENPVGSFGHAHFGQHVDVVPQSRIDGDQAIVLRKRLGEIMPSFLVQRVDFRPWRRKEYALVVAMDPAEALDHRLSRQMLKPGGSIDQASVEKTQRAEGSASARSASDTSIARRAKATASTQGSAVPPRFSSSTTIRRPGSSIVTKPRRRSSANNVDLPPLEQPEIMTKFSMEMVLAFEIVASGCFSFTIKDRKIARRRTRVCVMTRVKHLPARQCDCRRGGAAYRARG